MYPQEELILNMFLKGLRGDPIFCSQSQHQSDLSLLQFLLLFYDPPARPLIKIVIEGGDPDLH